MLRNDTVLHQCSHIYPSFFLLSSFFALSIYFKGEFQQVKYCLWSCLFFFFSFLPFICHCDHFFEGGWTQIIDFLVLLWPLLTLNCLLLNLSLLWTYQVLPFLLAKGWMFIAKHKYLFSSCFSSDCILCGNCWGSSTLSKVLSTKNLGRRGPKDIF